MCPSCKMVLETVFPQLQLCSKINLLYDRTACNLTLDKPTSAVAFLPSVTT